MEYVELPLPGRFIGDERTVYARLTVGTHCRTYAERLPSLHRHQAHENALAAATALISWMYGVPENVYATEVWLTVARTYFFGDFDGLSLEGWTRGFVESAMNRNLSIAYDAHTISALESVYRQRVLIPWRQLCEKHGVTHTIDTLPTRADFVEIIRGFQRATFQGARVVDSDAYFSIPDPVRMLCTWSIGSARASDIVSSLIYGTTSRAIIERCYALMEDSQQRHKIPKGPVAAILRGNRRLWGVLYTALQPLGVNMDSVRKQACRAHKRSNDLLSLSLRLWIDDVFYRRITRV